MIAALKPYPEYKESGLPWLGRVPGHWEIKRGKSYLNCIDERSKAGRAEDVQQRPTTHEFAEQVLAAVTD